MKKVLILVLVSLFAFLATTSITYAFTEGVQAKYGTDFSSYEEELEAAGQFNEELAAESFVLMKNDDNALPLSSSEKYVSLFGTRSDNIILGGAGSGGGSAPNAVSIKESLEAQDFRLNPSLVNIYSGTEQTAELPLSDIASADGSYAMYKDAAIVVFSRTGSEFNDAALYSVSGHDDLLDHTYSLDVNEKALINKVANEFDKVIVLINSAHPMELSWLQDHEGVSSIVWIGHPGETGAAAIGKVLDGTINPSGKTSDIYPAQFSMDPTWANFKGNIQSQLVVGVGEDSDTLFTYYEGEGSANNVEAPLNNGTDGIASNDWDYYQYSRATDSLGQTVTVDGPSSGARYYATLDYEEGIYMGYRWYETANEDGFFDTDSHGLTVAQRLAAADPNNPADLYYNRLDGVVYPFGYGLSYTTFDVEIVSANNSGVSISNGAQLNTAYGQEITLNVKVTNTGDVAGKKVVQVYYSAPYTSGEIEKASVNLVQFAKSKLLSPGQSETIQITFKVQDMASFDYLDSNNSGHAGYELDPGMYNIGVYDDSHTSLDSLDVEVVGSVVNYDFDSTTGEAIEVRFTGDGVWDGTRSDLDYYDSRRTSLVSETPMTYLTRADFDGTMPEAPTPADLRWSDDALLILQSQVYYSAFNDLPTDPWYKDASDVVGWDQADDTSARVDGKTAVSLYDMSGVAFDDPLWDTFLNQLTWDELRGLISSNRFTTPALDSIDKPASSDVDGPAQLNDGTFWVSEVNIASTWNTDMVYKQGLFVGNESLYQGVSGWYGPGLNIHRNPAAGRNFEYYSQDGIHSGLIAAAVIKGATDKGVVVYMKHLTLNDQETSRYTVSTFVTEQALREIYLRPWEYAIKLGNANASMAGFNKIGLLSTTSNYELYQGVLRDEFGFRGSSVTDMYGWGYSPGTTGDMNARLNITPLGSYANTFGRNIEGTWDAENNNVVITFNENITNGTRYTKDDETGRSTATINSSNPVNINYINNRDFIDYSVSGIEVDYSTTTLPGPSAAFTDATTMKDGTTLYAQDDEMVSYTQWYSVRTAAKSLLFAQANSNTMANGVIAGNLEGITATIDQGASVDLDVSYEVMDGALYQLADGSQLPEGLEVTQDGHITGMPLEAGEFTISVLASVGGYVNVELDHTITVAPTFVISGLASAEENVAVSDASIGSDDWVVGVSSLYIQSSWGTFPVTVSEISYTVIGGQLPDGLTLAADGTITGTPTVAGTFNATIKTHVYGSHQWFGAVSQDFVTPVEVTVAAGTPLPTSNVTFDSNYPESSTQVVNVLTGESVEALNAPYRPGYIFIGWFTDAQATTAVDFSATVDSDMTVYAGWLSATSVDDLAASINQSIADINAAIADSNSDIDDLVEALNTAVAALNTALQATDDDLSDEITTLNQAIATLNSNINDSNANIDLIEDQISDDVAQKPAATTAIVLGSVSTLGVGGLFLALVLKKKLF